MNTIDPEIEKLLNELSEQAPRNEQLKQILVKTQSFKESNFPGRGKPYIIFLSSILEQLEQLRAEPKITALSINFTKAYINIEKQNEVAALLEEEKKGLYKTDLGFISLLGAFGFFEAEKKTGVLKINDNEGTLFLTILFCDGGVVNISNNEETTTNFEEMPQQIALAMTQHGTLKFQDIKQTEKQKIYAVTPLLMEAVRLHDEANR